MTKKPTVGLVGAGSMGGALLNGWLKGESIDTGASAIFDPGIREAAETKARSYGFAINPPPAGPFDFLFLAVKPQLAQTALAPFSDIANSAVVVSVMAGVTTDEISKLLNGSNKIVRAMPNLPAAIGTGATGLYATQAVDDEARAQIDDLMNAVGETVWVEQEELIDAVTAISGSGPAYFFLMVEAMAEAGEALGLTRDAAMQLARATCVGAGAMLQTDARTATQLREAVTSPGGTTAAALGVLEGEQSNLRALMRKAAEAARTRAEELSG